jgi:S-adenosylmethionine synthetase
VADTGIAAAQCLMVSRIGNPVTRPAIVDVKLATTDGAPIDRFNGQVEDIVSDRLSRIPQLIDSFVTGAIGVV